MSIANSGTGTFNLTNGATASVAGLVSAGTSAATGNATINISGAGTAWGTGSFLSGTVGTAAVTISDGAVVTSTQSLGTNTGFVGGTMVVTGAGSEWRITGVLPIAALAIGKSGGATSAVTVSNGGRITVDTTAANGNLADLRIATTAAGTGNLTITGANSVFTTPYRVFGGFGANTTANVTVSNGGTFNSGFTILGAAAGSIGAVTVIGSGSVWNLADTVAAPGGSAQGLTIGSDATGTGRLTISDGGVVNETSSGSVNLGGAAGSSGTLNIGAAAADPAAAPGTLNSDAVVFVTNATGTVNFKHTSGSYVFAPQLTGAGGGSVNMLAGTTIFTNDNTYSAATTNVSAGATAQFGNGGTTGSTIGSITNNGTVAFNRSNSVSYAAVISGGGTLEQRGSGTLILSGANTFTGATTISSGTLQIGARAWRRARPARSRATSSTIPPWCSGAPTRSPTTASFPAPARLRSRAPAI